MRVEVTDIEVTLKGQKPKKFSDVWDIIRKNPGYISPIRNRYLELKGFPWSERFNSFHFIERMLLKDYSEVACEANRVTKKTLASEPLDKDSVYLIEVASEDGPQHCVILGTFSLDGDVLFYHNGMQHDIYGKEDPRYYCVCSFWGSPTDMLTRSNIRIYRVRMENGRPVRA